MPSGAAMPFASRRRRGCHGRAHDWTAGTVVPATRQRRLRTPRPRWLLTIPLGLALALAVPIVLPRAHAQRVGTLAQWKERVLDPTTLGLEPFPGAALNVKFTIDQIRLDETTAKIAVYIIPVDRMQAAADFYAKALGSTAETSGVGTLGELRVVKAGAGDAKRAGLVIRVENAQWATGKGQVLLRYDPPQPR
jgi:hypothetical protein